MELKGGAQTLQEGIEWHGLEQVRGLPGRRERHELTLKDTTAAAVILGMAD